MLKHGKFTSHSGSELWFKIECDNLTDEDLDCAARIICTRISFNKAIGIPRGGMRFAEALNRYRKPSSVLTAIVDDVYTTGKSMEEYRLKYSDHSFGLVLFARNEPPPWILPFFTLHNMWKPELHMHLEKVIKCDIK